MGSAQLSGGIKRRTIFYTLFEALDRDGEIRIVSKCGKNAKKKKTHKRYSGPRIHAPGFWKPGEPLTDKDRELLSVLVRRYRELGYTPSLKEVSNAAAVKRRFRLWSDAIEAAGLPRYNDLQQIRIREEKRDWERRMQKVWESGKK